MSLSRTKNTGNAAVSLKTTRLDTKIMRTVEWSDDIEMGICMGTDSRKKKGFAQ